MIEYIISTERLGLRAWREADIDVLAEMNADPAVMRHFPSVYRLEDSRESMQRVMKHQDEHGYCFWAADLLATGEMIGFIGLQNVRFEAEFTPCVEIGWRLRKEFWGKGLATEGATACLAHAFDKLRLHRVYSFTVLENLASERVMPWRLSRLT